MKKFNKKCASGSPPARAKTVIRENRPGRSGLVFAEILVGWILTGIQAEVEVVMDGIMSDAPVSLHGFPRWRSIWFTGTLLSGFLVGLGCKPKSLVPDDESSLASVVIKELEVGTYQRYQLEMLGLDGQKISVKREFARGAGTIQVQVVPGQYQFTLEYFRENELVFSSKLCKDTIRNDRQEVKKGRNDIIIRVCGPDSQPIGGGSGGTGSGPVGPSGTFSIKDGQLVDPLGKTFVMRGMNNPHAYYRESAYAALPTIRDFGFNTVRIVWCADNLIRAKRCEQKDIHPIGELDRILSRMRSLKLVAVLNLQNATGSDSIADLEAMAAYLLKPEVKAVLLKHKEILLLNIANEWYGTWDKTSKYMDGYRSVIPKLRQGGLPHTLIVDARGWGQDFSSIPEHAADFKALDPHVILSSHMYESYDSGGAVRNAFRTVRQAKIPFIVGEFACTHGVGKTVACETIIEEAAGPQPVGTIVWSMSGNSPELADLDFVSSADWKTPTPAFGERILKNPKFFLK